jgi:uncharacterized delta-60 repeat protein
MFKKIVYVLAFLFLLSEVSFSAPGDLDGTFNESGLGFGFFIYDGSNMDEGRGVAIQEDGKIVIVGKTEASNVPDVLVLRLNPDGTLDNTFGGDGIVTYDSGGYDRGYGIAIQKDGKIVVVGYTTKDTWDVLVLRYKSDGTLDNTFGDNGVVTYDSGYNDVGYGIAIQEDGKIVVVGFTGGDVLVLRYNPDGTLDNTFGGDGVVTYDGGYKDVGNGIAIQEDGKILVAGQRYNDTVSDVLVLRYNPDGTLDNTFGGDGVVTYGSGNEAVGYGIAIQGNGKIVVAGERYNSAWTVEDVLVLRYNLDGTRDNTFSGNGVAIYDSGNLESAYGIAVQEDGKIVITGGSRNNSISDVLVLRLNTNGTLDKTLGENGIVNCHSYLEGDDCGFAVAIQGDGNIVIAGMHYNRQYDVLALRLHGGDPDKTPPTPNPMTWLTPPYQTGTNSISMVATTATDNDPISPISYYFDFVSSPTGGLGGKDSGWQDGTSYTNSNLRANHKYGYRVKAKDGLDNQTAYSTTQYAYTAIQPPTGITFGAVTSSSIQARSTNTPSGLSRGSSGLLIENMTLGTNSGWKRSNTFWTSKLLTPNTSYTFQAKARNGNGIETGYGPSASKYTRANLPGRASFSDVTRTSIRANWTANGNPAGTEYFCQNVTTGANSGWITDTSWNSDTLACSTSYSFRVKAKNEAGVETGWISLGSQSTVKCIVLLTPNGGEVIPSGSSYDIQWNATPEAVSFDLFYSLDKGGSWISIAKALTNTIYPWQVPKTKGNKKACLVKVIGYNGATKKIGADTSDKPFTIEVVRLTSPNGGGAPLTQNDIIDITWTAYETNQPITKVKLYYTKDAGVTWNSIPGLSGATYPPGNYSQSWTVPWVGTTPKNKCKVKVVLKDAKGVIRGSDASDNYFTIKSLVPDLIETSVSNPPAAASPGSEFSVTDTVENQGDADAGPSTTRYYLSVDKIKGSTDNLLTGTRPVPALAPGAASTGTVEVTIPSSAAAGTYYLLACADNTKMVPESNETNNCIASSTAVQIQRPDLVETSVSNPPSTAIVGSKFPVTDTAENQGNANAESSTTQYYLSGDTIKGSADILLTGARSVPALAAEKASTGTVEVTIPSGPAAAAYYLLACADDLKVVAESNEKNNCIASTSTVLLSGPDLVETFVSNPPQIFKAGSTFNVTDTVENQGNADAGDSVTRYYLSKDTVKGSGDVLLTGGRYVVGLTPGESTIGTVSVTIPSGTAEGAYYLLACADDMEEVAETDDTNNCIASVTTVQVVP